MVELTILGGVTLWAITEAIVKLLKTQITSKYLPSINVLVGVVVVVGVQLLGLLDITLGAAIASGVVVGLSCAGFYDFRKPLIKGI